jgi:hypothetical protein
MLINNPTTETTQDSDWQEIPMGNASIMQPQGTWDADNTSPVLSDAGAVDNSGHFYNVVGAPTPVIVSIPGLFGGVATSVKNGDLVISNDVEWYVAPAAVTWETLNVPQVIIDYENGTVIAHVHEISGVNGVTGLQTALDTKFDSADVADSAIDFSLVPDDKLVDVGFLKKYFYTKIETVALLDGLPAGSVEGAVQYRNAAGNGFDATDTYYFNSGISTLNTPFLNITGAVVNDEAATQVAVINTGTGAIEWRSAASLAGAFSSPLASKGDIFTYDTDDQRLAVGTDGYILAADSAEATGLKWILPVHTTPAGNDNDIQLNSGGVFGTDEGFYYDSVKDMLVAATGSLLPDFTGAHAQSGSWSIISGEDHTFLAGRSVNLFVSGWNHTIGDDTDTAFSGAGAIITGAFNHVAHVYPTAMGYGVKALGYASIAWGSGYDFGG